MITPFFQRALVILALSAAWPMLAQDLKPAEVSKERLKVRDQLISTVSQLRKDGKLADAIVTAEKILALEQEVLGEFHADVADTLEWLAGMQLEKGDKAALDRARESQQKALAVREKLYPKSYRTTNSRLEMAYISQFLKLDVKARGRLAKADQLIVQVRQLDGQKKHKEALDLAEQARTIRQELLGEENSRTASALSWVSNLQTDLGNLPAAVESAQKVLDRRRKLFGDLHPEVASSLHLLAVPRYRQGNFAQAAELFREAWAIRQKLFGLSHNQTEFSYRELTNSLTRLGESLHAREDFAAAAKACQELIEVQTTRHGDKHWRTTNARVDLAYAEKLGSLDAKERGRLAESDKLFDEVSKLDQQKKYGEALELAKKGLAIRQQVLGDQFLRTAVAWEWIGHVLLRIPDYAAADQAWRAVLEIRRRLQGSENPEVTFVLNQLGVTAYRLNDFARAAVLHREAWLTRRKLEGPVSTSAEHSYKELTGSLARLAETSQSRDDFAAAAKARQELIEVQAIRHGDKHWQTTNARLDLALVEKLAKLDAKARLRLAEAEKLLVQVNQLDQAKKHAAALEAARQALEIRQQVLGEEDAGTAMALEWVGDLHLKLAQYALAREVFQKALALRRRLGGPDHPAVATVVSFLGRIAGEEKDFARATERHREAWTIRRQTLGLEDGLTQFSFDQLVKSLNQLAGDLEARGDFPAAIKARQELLSVVTARRGEPHWESSDARVSLAHVEKLSKLDAKARARLAEAQQLFDESVKPGKTTNEGILLVQKALEIRQQILGAQDPQCGVCHELLGRLYQQTSDPAKAEASFKHALEITRQVHGESHPAYASTLLGLARVYQRARDSAKAIQTIRQSLDIRLKLYGPASGMASEACYELAKVLLALPAGDPKRSIPPLLELLALQRKMPDQYPSEQIRKILVDLLAIEAGASVAKDDLDPARQARQAIFDLAKAVNGDADPVTDLARQELAQLERLAKLTAAQRKALVEADKSLLESQGKFEEATSPSFFRTFKQSDPSRLRPLLEPVQLVTALRQQLLGEAPVTADALFFLGELAKELEEHALARQSHDQALAIRKKVFGENHPQTKASFQAVCTAVGVAVADSPETARLTLAQRKRLEERDRIYQEFVELGMKDPAAKEDANAFYNRIRLQRIALLEKMLPIEREVRGPDHQETMGTLELLARQHEYHGNFAVARNYRQAIVQLKANRYGENHWQAVEARQQVAYVNRLSQLNREQFQKFIEAIRAPRTTPRPPGDDRILQPGEKSKRAAALIPPAEQVRNTVRQVLGEDSLYYANCLDALAFLYDRDGQPGKAEALYQQAAVVSKKVLSERHPATLRRLEALARFYQQHAWQFEDKEDFGTARKLWQQHQSILHLRYGENHWRALDGKLRVEYCDKLAQLSRAQREQLAQAELLLREYERSPSLEGDIYIPVEDPPTAPSEVGGSATGKPAPKKETALDRTLRGLQIRREVLGEPHPATARALMRAGLLSQRAGDLPSAETYYRQALEARRKTLGESHVDTAASLNQLGLLYYAMADYVRAEPLLRQANQLYEKLDSRNPLYVGTFNNLAVLHQALGDYSQAEAFLNQSVRAAEKITAEPMDPTAGPVQLERQHQTLLAEFNLTSLLEVQHATVPMPRGVLPEEAASLNNLAILFMSRQQYGRAEVLLREALGIVRRTQRDRDDDPAYASVLDNLATVYMYMDKPEQAELLFHRSLQIREKTRSEFGRYSMALNNLGTFYFNQGNLERAGEYWRQAWERRHAELGPEHPSTVISLVNLVALHEARGETAAALDRMRTAVGLSRHNLQTAFLIQSERQQLLRLQALRGQLDYLLSLAERSRRPGAEDYGQVLAWKGTLYQQQRYVRDQRRLIEAEANAEVAGLFRRYEGVSRRLAELALQPLTEFHFERDYERKDSIQKLTAEKETLEQELSRRSEAFRKQQAREALSVEQVQAALPTGSVLIDFLEYTHTGLVRPGEKAVREQRLAAFVIRPDGIEVTRIELGPVAPIAKAVEQWRKSFGRAREGSDPGADLRKLVWLPLEPHLGQAALVLISPDGALTRLPFPALPGGKPDTYLIEERAVAVVPVPQALPELFGKTEKKAPASLLLVGDVDFEKANKITASSRGLPTDEKMTFQPLPGTAKEIEALAKLFEKAYPAGKLERMQKAEATVDEFRRQAPQKRYLHLATHGFFAPTQVRSALAAAGQWDDQSESRTPSGWNPGLLSGVVFSGVNQQSQGILTALEVGALDLGSADLVVLSACETGLGEVAGGENVFGLQRAFQVAGARTVVASLWQVDDAATQLLMTLFYENLWQKQLGPAESMRQAQLAMLQRKVGDGRDRGLTILPEDEPRPGRLSPRLWAAWVLSGDPGTMPKKKDSSQPPIAIPPAKPDGQSALPSPSSDAASADLAESPTSSPTAAYAAIGILGLALFGVLVWRWQRPHANEAPSQAILEPNPKG